MKNLLKYWTILYFFKMESSKIVSYSANMCYSYPCTKKLTLHWLHIRRVQGSIISCANNLRCYWECVGEQLGNLVGEKLMGTWWQQGNKILSFALMRFYLFIFGLMFHDAGIEVCELSSADSLQCVEKWYQSWWGKPLFSGHQRVVCFFMCFVIV